MALAFRACLLVSAAAGLGACASDHQAAPIDYRGSPPARVAAVASVPAPIVTGRPAVRNEPPPAPVQNPEPVQRVVDMGPPSLVSAIDEAKGLRPEGGVRPGGAIMQPRDDRSARAIEVQSKDTLYDISRRYSVNMRALIETNRLEPPYALDPGRVIYLPPPNVHRVEKGETLYSVSRRYNVDTRSLALLNGLARPWTVWPGDELLLPPLARDQARDQTRAPVVTDAVVVKASPPPVAQPKPAPVPEAKAPAVNPPTAKVAVPPSPVDKPIVLAPPASSAKTQTKPPEVKPALSPPPPPAPARTTPAGGSSEFVWPVSGQVLKAFGTGADGTRNDGVNISAAAGSEVKAAAAGQVVYAGNELAGFGNLILIRHPGGWVTAYAHSDTMLVKEGELVKQGQGIARAGSTGNAGSPQVHFELRKGKEPVDPAAHLPPLRG